jgi:predicted TIM-barrel fold metal-dependent hydrolase
MTKTETLEREPLTDLLVVDTDVHVHESPGDLAPYIEMPWRKSLEHMADKAKDTYLSIPGFSPGTNQYHAQFPTGMEKGKKLRTPEQARGELKAMDIDLAILFPDHLLKIAVLTQIDYASALARAYNAWLTDQWVSTEHGLLGNVIACPQDPEDAAREIRRYASHPSIVGVYIPLAGVDPLYGNRKYDPIWDAAQETGLPVLLHAVNVVHPVYPFQTHGYTTGMARHATSHTFSIMVNLVDMLTNGVMSRFPDMRICSTEAGIAWLPWLMYRLDKEYVSFRREVPWLDRRPSEYLKDIWLGTQPIEEPEDMADIATLIQLCDAEDKVMFASDWPHNDFDHPSKVDQIPLSPEARRKIFATNALELFRIDDQGRKL